MDVKQQIMQAKTALKCKTLGKEIKNCDSAKWNTAAAKECYPGILSKFQQNVGIASYLKTTGTKTLLECSYDDVWGNGIPLSNPSCINPAEYKHQGILGSILEQVRDHLLNSADTEPQLLLAPLQINQMNCQGHLHHQPLHYMWKQTPMCNIGTFHVETCPCW